MNYLIGAIIIGVGIYVSINSGAKGMSEGAQVILGFLATFFMTIGALIFLMPLILLWVPGWVEVSAWNDVLTGQGYRDAGRSVIDTLERPSESSLDDYESGGDGWEWGDESYEQPEHSHQEVPATVPRHVVVEGETMQSIAQQYGVSAAEVASFNRLTANAELVPGVILYIPTPEAFPTAVPEASEAEAETTDTGAPSPTAVPQPTQRPPAPVGVDLSAQYDILSRMKDEGRIDEALDLIQTLQVMAPNNATLPRIKSEIEAAGAQREAWDRLGLRPSQSNGWGNYGFDIEGTAEVDAILSGYVYEIVDVDSATFASAKTEPITVQCVRRPPDEDCGGWLDGYRFKMRRWDAARHDADEAGQQFGVP